MSDAQARLDAIKGVYDERMAALKATRAADEFTREEFQAEVVDLTREALRRARSLRASVERQRDELHRLIVLGARSGWAQDQAGEWRFFVEVGGGAFAEMP